MASCLLALEKFFFEKSNLELISISLITRISCCSDYHTDDSGWTEPLNSMADSGTWKGEVADTWSVLTSVSTISTSCTIIGTV